MIKKSTAFLVDYFFHTGIVASFLYINCQLIRGFKIEYHICLLIFLATMIIYNYSNLSNSLALGRKIIIVISSILLLLFCIINFEILVDYASKIFVIILLVILYIFPENKIQLRNIGILKIFLLSITWALTAVLPNSLTNSITQYCFIFSFLFVFSLSIPFDIRDVKIDNLKTIPKLLGTATSRIIALVSFSCSMLIEYFLTQSISISLTMIIIGIPLIIHAIKYHQNKYALAAVELIIILNGLLLFSLN